MDNMKQQDLKDLFNIIDKLNLKTNRFLMNQEAYDAIIAWDKSHKSYYLCG